MNALRPSLQRLPKTERTIAGSCNWWFKSGLLAQLSHTPFIDPTRGLDAAITVENLFRLNRSDIAALNDNLGFRKVERLLGALSRSEPGVVSLQGTGPGAVLRIELDAIDLTELLEVRLDRTRKTR